MMKKNIIILLFVVIGFLIIYLFSTRYEFFILTHNLDRECLIKVDKITGHACTMTDSQVCRGERGDDTYGKYDEC